jgi:hypothetical protein
MPSGSQFPRASETTQASVFPPASQPRRASVFPPASQPRRASVFPPASQPRPAGQPPKDLHEHERLVLRMKGLAWPPTPEQLQAARREFAILMHPDRGVEMPGLAALNDGCDRLRTRLGF